MTALISWGRPIRSFTFLFMVLILLLGQASLQTVQAAPVTEKEAPAPLAAPLATVTLSLPPKVQIGQTFSFTAAFDNTDADEVGYGPFIDLVFPVTGTDGAGAATDDGINFVSATYLGASVITVTNTFGTANTGGCTGGLGPVTHPYAVTLGTGAPHIVCGIPGDKLVTFLLPFGSFTPDQPPAVVTVNATVSNLADLNAPLTIRARGGYQYGATPTNDWCCLDATIVSNSGPSNTWPGSSISPILVSLTKTYNGPEDETATGPNYLRQYTLTVDLAAGQPVNNLTITDNLPNHMQFVSVNSSAPSASCTTPSTTTPGGTLTCNFGTVTGGAGATDAVLVFNFFIPLNNSGATAVINATSGDDVTSINSSTAGGSWHPVDARDTITPFTEGGVCPNGCHTLIDKSIAIQKSVVDLIDAGVTGFSPGDTLEYTLNFQVSDFFSFQNVIVTDVLSDGQRITGTPTLQVNGNEFSLSQSGFDSANFTVDNSQIGYSGPGVPPDGTDGSQSIILRVSDEMITRGQSGKLIGGCVPVAGTGGSQPDCNVHNDDATTVTIRLRAVIQNEFTDTYPSGDASVDHGDHIDNAVTVVGNLLSAADNATVTGQSEADASSTTVNIEFGTLNKSVYAVNGTVCTPCTNEVSTVGVNPGDLVTFRLRYTQPSSDFEATTLTDYLPLPLFHANDADADGAAGPAWSQDASAPPTPPASGKWKYGPNDSFHSMLGATAPTVASNATNNSVTFSYPQYDDPSNSTSEIDLLFTVTVSSDPFADGLFLTNQARSSEGTTNAGVQIVETIIQVKINEPLLIPTKSAVSTDSAATGINFTPAIAAPIVFDAPGVVDGTPDWTGGIINSQYLTSHSINADLSGIDGGDRIKFAIVIENRGGGVNGAFDIAIKDAKPAQLVIPASGLNLEVFLGDGTPISFTDLGGSLFGSGIQLIDPGVPASGACQAHHDTNGQNVIIITYDLQLDPAGVTSTNITNTTTLLSYSSSEGGPNFIPSGVTDTATITPHTSTQAKTLKATSETHTLDTANPARMAVGEIARYRLSITLPEGSFPNFQVRDQLPNGLTYLNDGTARIALISNGSGFTSANTGTLPVPAIPGGCVVNGNETTAIPDPLPCVLNDLNVGNSNSTAANADTYISGTDPYFKLGDLVNGDEDDDSELVVIEFNALADNSVAGSNDAGDNHDNNFQLYANSVTYGAASGNVRVRMSEPIITDLDKSVLPTSGDAGDPVAYTLTFSNNNAGSNGNTTTAFDVNLTDTIPAKIALNLGSLGITYAPAACSALTSNTSAGNNINLMFATVPVSCRITVTYQGTLLGTVTPGETLLNTANVKYTSLPGDHGTTSNATGSSTTGNPGTDLGERDGRNSPSQNDYFDSDNAQVDVTAIQPVKSLVSSSDPLTLNSNLTIGEVARYRMAIRLPEGTSPTFQLQDNIPTGMQYLNDGATRVAFVSDNGDPSCATSTSSVASDDVTIGTSPWICGNDTTVTTITPTYALPGTAISGAPFADGTDPTFALGGITNNDTDANQEYIVVEFNARMLNVASNQDSPATVRNNNFTVFIGSSNKGTSNDVPATVVEPVLTLDKQLSSITGEVDAGGVANYTVTLTNTGTAPAYNSHFFDTLPAILDFNPASVTVTPAGGASGVTDNSSDALNRVDLLIDTIPVGGSVTITYSAAMLVAVTPEQLIQNVGNVTWTSLDGTQTGERTGAGGVDDYTTNDNASFTTDGVTIAKQLTMTSAAHTTGSNVAIGEVLTYDILLTFPEGATPTDTVVDDLPVGLMIVGSPQVIMSAASSSGVLTADFNGTVGTQNITTDTSDGGSVQFDLTNVVANIDNVTTNNTLLLRFQAQVTNINVNQAGHTISNVASNQVGTGTPESSNQVDVKVVEPVLTIDKSADDTVWVYGQSVIYTLNVTNDIAISTADAFEVVVTDTIPTGLTYTAGSISAPAGWTANDSAAPTLTWTCAAATPCSLPVAGTASLSYQVTVNTPPGPPAPIAGDATVTNTASMTWTSLSGVDTGERTGSGGINDYTTSDNLTGGLENYYAIGNRVWFDTNNNSQIDFPNEVGVDGVKVDLYAASDLTTILTSDTTTNGGYYLFDFLAPGNYVVAVSASNFTGSGKLVSYWSSGTHLNGVGVIYEDLAANAELVTTDSDDNGMLQSAAPLNGAVIAQAVTLGPTEPLNEGDLETGVGQGEQPDNRANMTVDFGFYRTSIGNIVWLEDVTVDGAYAVGETLINNASVRLYAADGATEILVGGDGRLGTGDDGAGGVSTASGVYKFSGLPEGAYIVKVVGPSDTLSTTDVFDAADSASPDVNTDSNDNGIGIVGNSVSSAAFTMEAGDAGLQTNNTVTNSDGTTSNPTLDFGFAYPYAIGNRVWFDTNNNSQIDFPNEVGVDGVKVDLYAASDLTTILTSDTTTNGGYYLFDNLFPGDYVVVIPASNFTGSGKLVSYWSSGTALATDGSGAIQEVTAELAETPTDSDDNGTRQPSVDVISSVITLGPSGLVEPINESDLESGVGQGSQPDGRSNLTVDFGFYRVEVGDLLFGDLNKNGTFDAGDTRLDNVTVQIFASNGTTEFQVGPDGILGTGDDAAGGMSTDVNGQYLFSGLPEGDYIIRATAPAGTVSTIDSFDQTDNDTPATNTDDNDNGDGILGGAVSSAVVTLDAGSTGLKNNNTVTNASGTTSNPTVDFGFSLAYALGNRVWFDTNNNSQIDLPNEVGVDGVLVQLYSASDLTTVLASDTTSNGGYYLFNNLDAGDYVVVIPSSNFDYNQVLHGYWSSGITMNPSGLISELTAPDVDVSASDIDDNGIVQMSGPFDGGVISLPVTIGPGGVEPRNESDLETGVGQGQPDEQANMTVDFGFYTITLGNLVWNDANLLDNGLFDSANENGIQFVQVELYSADGTRLLGKDTTDSTGHYGFHGLPEGSYIVRISATNFNPGGVLRDYTSSRGGLTSPYEPAPNPDLVPVDSDDNGTVSNGLPGLGGYVQSGVFDLKPAAEESVDDQHGLTIETRVDFGVFNSPMIDLSVTKDDNTTYYLSGGTLTYTIVVTNNGPADALSATVSDALPPQIASWTWECVSATGGASGCTAAADLTADFSDDVDLPQLATITYKVTAIVSDTASGPLTNSVSVTPKGMSDMNLLDNTATDVDQPASLQVTKDDGLSIVGVGSTLTYQIVITNTGAIDLTSLTVTDNLPADLIFQSANPAPTSTSGSLLTWSGVSLNSGASKIIRVTAKVSDTPKNTTITNVVNVVDVPTGADGTDDDIDSIATGSDFSKVIVSTNHDPTLPPDVAIGEIITYKLSLVVQPGSMDNARVVDAAQSGLAFVDCVALTMPAEVTSTRLANGVCNDGAALGSNPQVENSGAKVTFDFGTLTNASAAPQVVTIRYSMVVLNIKENQQGVDLMNNAAWNWTGGSLTVSGPKVHIIEPDMYIEKISDISKAPYGAVITFTLNVGHTDQSLTHAYNVVVTDILPTGLAYVANSISSTGLAPTSSTYDPGTYKLSFTWDEFQLGQTSSISFKAIFNGPSPLTNTANVAWTSLPIDSTVVQSPYNGNSRERWYDPIINSDLDNYGAHDELTISLPTLPQTGFEAGVITPLPIQPYALKYTDLGNFWIEIPQLGVKMPIVGVPLVGDGWDLTWLGQQAGWLQGTAYPTLSGNSVITAHVFDSQGLPGPFVDLNKLYWGHKIIVHLNGQKYIYEVREVRIVWPEDKKVFQHEDLAWLTLITCKDYNAKTGTYAQRVAVRAVLLSVEPDN